MSFIVWIILLVGGLVLKAQSPQPFDGAHTVGTVMFWIAVIAAILNVIALLVFAMFWKKTNNDIRSGFSSRRF